jgi:hypothetical protein
VDAQSNGKTPQPPVSLHAETTPTGVISEMMEITPNNNYQSGSTTGVESEDKSRPPSQSVEPQPFAASQDDAAQILDSNNVSDNINPRSLSKGAEMLHYDTYEPPEDQHPADTLEREDTLLESPPFSPAPADGAVLLELSDTDMPGATASTSPLPAQISTGVMSQEDQDGEQDFVLEVYSALATNGESTF